MTITADPAPRTRLWRIARTPLDLVVGTFLCANPITSLIALGWLTRRMRAITERRWGAPTSATTWLLGPSDAGAFARLFGGLGANIRAGLVTALGLAALCLPFTALWIGAWWAGWENSFNKGYEQASIGPVVWFLGAAISLVVITHLPMALAHHAAEQRFAAFFELRRIRSVVREAGWRAPALTALTVLFAVPLLGGRGLPVFVENIVPGFADMNGAEQADIAGLASLLTAAWAFLALLVLRGLAARLYAAAAPRAAAGIAARHWEDARAARERGPGRRPSRGRRAVWFSLNLILAFGLPALIVIGQFINHSWALWLTHPMLLLPWPG